MSPELQTGNIAVGTAGWSIPPELKEKFPSEGTHLTRYAQMLNAVEINSSFYREHKPETYEKWARSVPANFRFSAKLLRYFTQEKRLKETGTRLQESIQGMSQLGEKWAVLLVQLPPSLEFVAEIAEKFLGDLRRHYSGLIAWEPRHSSWGTDQALDLLASYRVQKVLADPEPVFVSQSRRLKVETELVYYRLHGTPEIYKSKYSSELIGKVQKRLLQASGRGKAAWCIFDNTTFGFATDNALELIGRRQSQEPDLEQNKRMFGSVSR